MAFAIANLWARRVASGDNTLGDVPPALRAKVETVLNMISAAEQLGGDGGQTSTAIDQLASAVRKRVAAGEDLRQIIRSLDLGDADKWELERKVKEG